MTEKLTLEWCFKYPNARVQWGHYTGFIKTIYVNIECIEFDSEREFSVIRKVSDCKLILRPLSSLTDEEKEIEEKLKKRFYYYVHNDRLEIMEKIVLIESPKSIDYLRSINIDIDGLQEKGVAVYE